MGYGSTDGILPPSRIDLREIAVINGARNGDVSNFIFIREKKIRGSGCAVDELRYVRG